MKNDKTGLEETHVSTDRHRSRRAGGLAFSACFVAQPTSACTFFNKMFLAVQDGERTRSHPGWTMRSSNSLRTEN
jgi:hypothetical protein